MENNNGTKKLIGYCKLMSALVAVIIAIGAGVIGFDSRYVTAEEHEKDLSTMQQQTIKSFEEFREGVKKDSEHRKLDFLTERYYRLKDLLRKYPDDRDLVDEITEVKEAIKDLKKKLETEEEQ